MKGNNPDSVTRYNSFYSFSGDEYPKLEFTVFGLLSVTAGLANLRLPETLGRPLPETIMDMILLGESSEQKYFVMFSKFYWRLQNSFVLTHQGSESQGFSQLFGMKIFLCPPNSNLLLYRKVDNDIEILILCSSYSSIPVFIMLCLSLSFIFCNV
jgi:hypothetical protein